MKRYFYDEDAVELIVHDSSDNAIKILPCIAEEAEGPEIVIHEAPKPEKKKVSAKEFLESKRKKKDAPANEPVKRKNLTPKLREEIQELHQKGRNSKVIADITGLPIDKVNSVIADDDFEVDTEEDDRGVALN